MLRLLGKLAGVIGLVGALSVAGADLTSADAPPAMPEGYVLGVDSSYDLLTLEEAYVLKESGVAIYVQALSAVDDGQLEHPAYRVESLRNAATAGLHTAGYALIHDGDGRAAMDFAFEGLPEEVSGRLLFVGLDVETRGPTIATVNQAFDRLLEFGKPEVLYANRGAWNRAQLPPLDRPNVLVWSAIWDADSDIDYGRYTFAGLGEERVIGEQYDHDLYFGGQHVDLNVFTASLLQETDSSGVTVEAPPFEESVLGATTFDRNTDDVTFYKYMADGR